MPIYALGDLEPKVDATAYVHPDAIIIGDVTLGPESSVWPAAVLRAEKDSIVIGARSNVQDGSVIHVSEGLPTIVHEDVLIGHLAHLESCTVHAGAFIGSGSIVLHRAVIGSGAVVGGHATVIDDTIVPPGALALGTPVTIREGAAREGMALMGARYYVDEGRHYRTALRRLD
jgi:carbonic anhydrase/acetyltransferase-like protein (isoleucine patch superfamily)